MPGSTELGQATFLRPSPFVVGAQICSLYEDKEEVELREVGPYLIAVDDNSMFLERLIDEGWGRAWGVYFSCDQPFEEVRKHLHHFLKVKTEDGEELYFRFYDPRVLRVFLPTCTPEQLIEFFGPIKALWVEAKNPTACNMFRMRNFGLETEVIHLGG